MKKSFAVVACIVGGFLAQDAGATPLPAVTASYEGNFDINNAFTGHGLWFANIFGAQPNDKTWSIDQTATNNNFNFQNGQLDISGTVLNTVNGVGASMEFAFRLFEDPNHPGVLQCGNTNCGNPTQQERDNIVFFDGDANNGGFIGKVTGTGVLDGLQMDVFINSPDSMTQPVAPKLGQLGYGGNWTTSDFGYSNWFTYDIKAQATDTRFVAQGTSGDINLTLTGNPNSQIPPVPLPAGLPLLIAGLGAFAMVRRRQRA
ncbi:MAG: VPLPA-CTERM sorting domain-containing protein [Pseudomonadota bacterium]